MVERGFAIKGDDGLAVGHVGEGGRRCSDR